MGKHFSVTSRKLCDCGKLVSSGFRKFCSAECREKTYKGKYKETHRIWQQKRYDKKASTPSPEKVKCLVCVQWYVQIGTHVILRHGFESAREYRAEFSLPLKRGIVPKWYREQKAMSSVEGGGIKNLKKGAPFRYKKGDKRAITNTGYKGRAMEIKKLSQSIYPH